MLNAIHLLSMSAEPFADRVRIAILLLAFPLLLMPNGQDGLPGLICWLIAFYSWAKDLSSVSVLSFILQITRRGWVEVPVPAK